MKTALLALVIWSVCFQGQAQAAPFPFPGLEKTLNRWGFPGGNSYVQDRLGRPVRIAILDKTFLGFEKELGKTLPSNTQYFEGPVQIPGVDPSAHGLRMAQLMSFIATHQMRKPENIELRLYRVAGYSNFKAAIQAVIDWQADVVLHSEVWEVGGNYDGKGFLNAEVNRAVRSGILWVNAAGNFEGWSYQTLIRVTKSGQVELPETGNFLKVECEAEKGKKCPLRAVLVWNSFTNETDAGVDEDLDFELFTSRMETVAKSELRQIKENRPAALDESKYPRESMVAELSKGTYYFQVTSKTRNFSSKSFLRIFINGDKLNLPFNVPGETMMNPADNPAVLTVGAIDSNRSSVSLRMNKPEIFGPSQVKFQDGNEFRGSSNAAAFTAGLIVLLKKVNPELSKADVINYGLRWNCSNGAGFISPSDLVPCQRGLVTDGRLLRWPMAFGW